MLKRAETVDIAADRLGPELAELERAGRVALTPAQPGVDQVRGRPLVIAATGDDAEDARVAAIARALGVPVNVPDKPALCSFVMPAIVDRGEVTVAIGTEGTSPVLAQRLRAWLERELHPRLDALARLAGDFRDAVAEKLPAGRPRRKFWEGVFDGAASEAAPCRRGERSAPPGRAKRSKPRRKRKPCRAACSSSAPVPAILSC